MSIAPAQTATRRPRARRLVVGTLMALHDMARDRYVSTRVERVDGDLVQAAGLWFGRDGRPVDRPDLLVRLVRPTKEIAALAQRGDALARIAKVRDWNLLPTTVLQAVVDALEEGNADA